MTQPNTGVLPLMSVDTDSIERSVCSCSQCRAPCKAMPGMLVPEDFVKIQQNMGVEPMSEEGWKFISKNFVASEGATVGRRNPDGTVSVLKIGTVTPATKADGSCVFLDSNERCSIHAVSPYGCRAFTICEPPSQAAQDKSAAGLREILDSPDYHTVWEMLAHEGRVAAPLQVRRGKLVQLLQNINQDSPNDGRAHETGSPDACDRPGGHRRAD